MSGVAEGRLASYTLVLALGLSALGGGAVHLSILALYALLVVASSLLSCQLVGPAELGLQEGRKGPYKPVSGGLGQRLSVACGVWLALAVVCWLQVAPLPLRWLEAVAPTTADIWSRALRPFGASPPEFACLSLAPGRTLVEALKFASYGLVFAVSARLTARNGMARMAWGIFLCALAVALVTAAHQVFGATALYGLYEPIHSGFVAPILSRNAMAGYLNVGVFAGLGLLLRRQSASARPLVAVGLVCILTEVILCQSRGALASLTIGLLVLLVFLPASGGRQAEPLGLSDQAWPRIVLVGLVAVAGLMAGLAARRDGWGRLQDESLEKFDLFAGAARLARDQMTFGVGRGAFGSVFFSYQGHSSSSSYDHAENLLLQWAAEWGWCVTGAALLALAWSLRPLMGARVQRDAAIRRCLTVGCGVLLAHSLVDLGLEIPAQAALLAATLGGLAGALQKDAGLIHGLPPPLVPGKGFVLVLASLTAVSLLLALGLGSDSLPQQRRRLFAEASSSGAGGADFWPHLRVAMASFPADPYFPLLGSHVALRSGQNPLPWLARALERAPQYVPAHLQRAQVLRAVGATSQALDALRYTIELDPTQAVVALRMGRSWGLEPESLRRSVPDGARGAPLLRALAMLIRDPLTRMRWLEEAAAREPSDPETHYLIANELLKDLKREQDTVLCLNRAACVRSAFLHANASDVPGDPRALILRAHLLAEQGQGALGEAQLWSSCELFVDDAGCFAALVRLCLDNESSRLAEAVRRFVAVGCSNPKSCSSTYTTLGDMYSRAGRKHAALLHYEQAARQAPSARSLGTLARLSRELGHDKLADDALRRVQLLAPVEAHGGDPLQSQDQAEATAPGSASQQLESPAPLEP